MSIISELVSVMGTLLGAWGVALAIISNIKNRKLKTVTWSDIQSATKFFWRKLKHEKFVPTYIVTPGQKGGIIAQLISDFYEEEIPIFSGFLEKRARNMLKIIIIYHYRQQNGTCICLFRLKHVNIKIRLNCLSLMIL